MCDVSTCSTDKFITIATQWKNKMFANSDHKIMLHLSEFTSSSRLKRCICFKTPLQIK